MTEPLTATAAERPCELYEHHAPRVVQTEGHHRRPMYLQRRLWGEVRDHTLLYLCGNCHAAVHEWLGYLLGETRQPNPVPGWKARAEAQAAVDWYRQAS